MSEAIQVQEYLAQNMCSIFQRVKGTPLLTRESLYRFSAQKLKKGRGVSNLKKLILMEGKI